MNRRDKIIVVLLGLLSLSFLTHMVGFRISQTPRVTAPGAPAAVTVDPSAKVNLSWFNDAQAAPTNPRVVKTISASDTNQNNYATWNQTDGTQGPYWMGLNGWNT